MTKMQRVFLALALTLAIVPNLGCSHGPPEMSLDRARIEPLLQQKVDALIGPARPRVVKGEVGQHPHFADLQAAAPGFQAILGELRTAVGHGLDVDVSLELVDESGARVPVTTRVVLGGDAPEGEDAPSLRVEDHRAAAMILVAGGSGSPGHDGANVEVVIGAHNQVVVALGGDAGGGRPEPGLRLGGNGGKVSITGAPRFATASLVGIGGRGGDSYGASDDVVNVVDPTADLPGGESVGSAKQAFLKAPNGANGGDVSLTSACGGGISATGGNGGAGQKGGNSGVGKGGFGGDGGKGGNATASCSGGDPKKAGWSWAKGGGGGQGGWGGTGFIQGGFGGHGGKGGDAAAATSCEKGWTGAYGGRGGNGGGGAKKAPTCGGKGADGGLASATGVAPNQVPGLAGANGPDQLGDPPLDCDEYRNDPCIGVDVDDGNPCTDDFCDQITGEPDHAPADQGTPCRDAANDCDVAEVCTGSTHDCPTDEVVDAGTGCTGIDDDNICTTNKCNGTVGAPACEPVPGNAGVECRGTNGNECDVAEKCDGSSSDCPADVGEPATTPCMVDLDFCTDHYCDGAGECSHHPVVTCPEVYFTFDVSTYNVDTTLNTGEHQGLGSRKKVRMPGGEFSYSNVNHWYNHGRTVSYVNGSEGPCARELASAGPFTDPTQIQQIESCIAGIPDGPCDAKCNSCKYCLPIAILNVSDCYDGIAGADSDDTTGGHNSNNDARMVRELWNQCIGGAPQASPGAASCSIFCGGGGSQSNVATFSGFSGSTDPDYHSDGECTFVGEYGIDNNGLICPDSGKQPICESNGKPVCGLG